MLSYILYNSFQANLAWFLASDKSICFSDAIQSKAFVTSSYMEIIIMIQAHTWN